MKKKKIDECIVCGIGEVINGGPFCDYCFERYYIQADLEKEVLLDKLKKIKLLNRDS